jgi:hypothetical protein
MRSILFSQKIKDSKKLPIKMPEQYSSENFLHFRVEIRL